MEISSQIAILGFLNDFFAVMKNFASNDIFVSSFTLVSEESQRKNFVRTLQILCYVLADCHNSFPAWDVPEDALRSGEGTAAAYVFHDSNLITDFKTTNTHFRNKLTGNAKCTSTLRKFQMEMKAGNKK